MLKKIYFSVLILAFHNLVAFSGPGDTTVIQAHQRTELSWYDNYDTTVTFPDGSLTYRKVIMEFTLGKYACPGYNPNTPGEGPGQTGWCADWDYDIHLIACVPGGDTIELGRLITPYANSNFPRTPARWQHAYLFDVTDFYPLLKNQVTMRIHYSGYSGGFTGSLRFHFIEGTPARNVTGIRNLWQGSYPFGHPSGSIDTRITAKTLTMPANAQSAAMRVLITGHGGDKTENCAEFCRKWYQFKVNDNMIEQKDIWRDDCGSNFLYPQSGTWVHNRGNWCPGDLVRENIHNVPASVNPGSTFTADLDFQNYSSADSSALYKVAAAMIFYGAFNHTLDAGLEEIISPNNDETYYRYNPVCGQPVVKVKNYGSAAVTSIKFEYGIEGKTPANYTWTGNLASLKEAEITLPSINPLNEASEKSTFLAKIISVNEVSDEEGHNNELKSDFSPAPRWDGGNFRIDFKMSGNIQRSVNNVSWAIKDMNDNILFERKGTETARLYQDEVHLEDGCYKLEVSAEMGLGLSYFTYYDRGYLHIFDRSNNRKIAVPKADLGSSYLDGNFGNGFTQHFIVQNSVELDVASPDKREYLIFIYPNPAKDQINVVTEGDRNKEAEIRLLNLLGQTVFHTSSQQRRVIIPTGSLANGIYYVEHKSEGRSVVEKIIIAK